MKGPAIGGPEWREAEEPDTPESVLADVLCDLHLCSANDLEETVRARVEIMLATSDAALQTAIIEQLSGDTWIGLYPLRIGKLVEESNWPAIRQKLAFNTLYCAAQRKLFDAGREIGPKV